MSERTEDIDDHTQSGGLRGPRLVAILYVALVAVAGLAGVLVAVFVDGLRPPRFLFLVPFPPTPLGFGAYGALTIALVLGIPLALVIYVSQNIDEKAT
ncbi:cox cluster protein [Halogeometricum borinquense]|uniref:Cox cluster protein n=1 Tax=Halogeometricum borinquense TaxID=60847 RepID=A0A6C0UI62_9EURY|nr:cox cluster protein [Halogeometricum borinquense]QIQ77096.1 cox cluster protein [Halogeometricum borinquense]